MAIDHYGYGIGGWVSRTSGGQPAVFTEGSDLYWMSIAMEEAMNQVGLSSPNPTVGCVFVKDCKLLAKGATESFGGAHGERVAANKIKAGRAVGSTVYVTLEPCAHTGKQPPCAELLVELGIKRCVIAMLDPFKEVNGAGIKYLEDHGVKVDLGVMAKEAMAWHLPFLFSSHYNRPLLVGKWAQTFDGHLADDIGASKWITGEESRAYTHFLRQKYDAIMVGSGTVISDCPNLNVRDCKTPINRSPLKIIVDPKGKLIKISGKKRDQICQKTLVGELSIYCGPNIKGSWLDREHIRPVNLKGSIDESLIARLAEIYQDEYGKPLQSIFVEGGANLLTRLINADLVDVFHTFQRPSLLGGQENRIGNLGRESENRRHMHQKRDLYLLATIILGQDIVVESISKKLADEIWIKSLQALNLLKTGSR